MIKENWHTHTKRCEHAIGEDEEYVQAAIKAGVRILGFSDHAAYPKFLAGERMHLEEVPEYISSIQSLKEKYKNQIEIHLGMEVECYPSQWETLAWYRRNLEYCLLGQHNLELDTDSAYDIRDRRNLMIYVDRIEEACRRGLCDYICHPDVALWSYPKIDEAVREAAERIAKISLKYNMPLELNCGSGVREGPFQYEDGTRYAYPSRAFFEVFAKHHCPVIIGMDIHDPSLFLTDRYLNRALDVVKGLNLNFIDHYDLISEAEKRKKLFY